MSLSGSTRCGDATLQPTSVVPDCSRPFMPRPTMFKLCKVTLLCCVCLTALASHPESAVALPHHDERTGEKVTDRFGRDLVEKRVRGVAANGFHQPGRTIQNRFEAVTDGQRRAFRPLFDEPDQRSRTHLRAAGDTGATRTIVPSRPPEATRLRDDLLPCSPRA